MLTKAAKQLLQTVPIYSGLNNTNTAKPMFPNDRIKNTANQERWISFLQGNLMSSTNIVFNANAGFVFGTGSTAPTENDYILESQITSGITGVLTNTVRGIDTNNKPYIEFTFTVTNTGSSSISITEIGYVTGNAYCCTSSTATSAANNNVLIDRTLLDGAVTIAAGNSAAIKYRLTSDMTFQ